ncbi:MAG: hypothetical protein JXO44_14000 [Clostridia bacterium]|nr:hypothetical protein [Clostridia bacterium]
MNKKLLVLALISIIMAWVFNDSIHSAFILEKIQQDDWAFEGGKIGLHGLKSDFEYQGLHYIGEQDLSVKSIDVEIRGYSKFSGDKYKLLSKSSIGDAKGIVLNKDFEYGGGTGSTHSTSVMTTYLLNKVELYIVMETEGETVTRIIEIPLAYGR